MSATFSKRIPQSLESTLAGVNDGECGANLAYILSDISLKENGSITDKLHQSMPLRGMWSKFPDLQRSKIYV